MFCHHLFSLQLDFFDWNGGPTVLPCPFANHFTHFKPEYCQPIDLDKFFSHTNKMFTDSIFCKKCSMYNRSCMTALLRYHAIILNISFYCKNNCSYCFWKASSKHKKLENVFVKNISKFEDVVLPKFKNVVHIGPGEFFDNDVLMKTYLKWHQQHNKNVVVKTNLINFDRSFPLKAIDITVHKSKHLDAVFDNLQYLVSTYSNLFYVTFMLDDNFAFTYDEAFSIVKSLNLQQSIIVVYRHVQHESYMNNQLTITPQLQCLIDDTKRLGYKVKFHYSDHYYLKRK